ncbi:Tll0287-like domain-containing protein [Luteimonas saliphila]|uniref:Tll0287-like domain-containing protein n=1 Tax=Luteimonas saliphila TaxID=2804919 RepID=UPI00192D95FD|nr:DUF3365 domain-containing protein [Luteimonas saliphila]
MTVPRTATIAALFAMLASACVPAPEAAPAIAAPGAAASASFAAMASEDADLERAKAAATAFSTQLRGTLQAAVAEGGPTAAIGVCSTDAPRIADAVMAEHDLHLGRVALPGRNRNPAQAADNWQLATLQRFQQAVAGGAAAGEQLSVTRDGLPAGVSLRMMRGIATEPGCPACHGKHVAPDVRDAIALRYPDDGATGFDIGDLRGALWVEVPTRIATPTGGNP